MPKIVRPIWGEFKDQNIYLDDLDADQAITDGWAFDPYSEASREPVPILTDGERALMEEHSKKAIAKLRGEDYFEPQSASKESKASKTKELKPDEDSGGSYQTRGSTSKAKSRDD